MKNIIGLIVLLVAILGVAGLAGCGAAAAQTASAVSPSPTTISGPINMNVNSNQGIWVNGQGTVMVTPDIATINLGVSAQAAKVADAQSQAATGMSKVMDVLTNNGIDQKDITTQQYSINLVTRYDQNTQQNITTGYRVDNIVTVKIRTISKVGTIIDAVTAAAGDLTRINNIDFSVDNPEQYYSQARTLAMNEAKAKAQQLAELAGVTLGSPTYIAENNPSPSPLRVPAPSMQAAPSVTTSISPGQTEIDLYVQVAYSIR